MGRVKGNISTLITRLQGSALFKDSFWALLGNALGKGLSLLAGVAIARFLGSEHYGEYGVIKNTLMMIAIFSSFGLGYSATKFIAENREDKEKKRMVHKIANYLTFAMSGLIAVVVFLCAKYVAILIDAPHLANLLKLSAVAIVFNALITTQVGELAGFGAYKQIAKNNTIVGIVTFILSIPLAYYYGLEGAVVALVVSLLLNCVLNRISLRKIIPAEPINIDKSYFKEIVAFSFPIALQESLYSVVSWGTTLILIKLAGYVEFGIYTAACQWMSVMLFVPGALRNVALSHLSATNSDAESNRTVLKRLMAINFVSTFVPFLVIAALSGWICSWYGESYQGLQLVLNIGIFTAVINSLTNVLTQELMAHGKNWYLFFSYMIRDVGILIGIAILIPLFGNGAVVAAFTALIFQIIYFGVVGFKYYKI